MRVLHLLDAAGPHACPTTLSLLAQSLGRLAPIEQQVCLLGPPSLDALARSAGVTDALRINVLFGRAAFAWPAARRKLPTGFDLIHCWSPSALTLAALHERTTPRVMTAVTPHSRRTAHWLRVLCAEAAGRTILLPISSTLRRDLLTAGVAEPIVHVLRPAIDMGAVAHASRKARRAAWEIADDLRVMTLLCDPPTRADASTLVHTLSLANDALSGAQPPLRLLVHPQQRGRGIMRRMLRDMNREHWLLEDDVVERPWEALPACDIALAVGPAAGGLSLLWAMAANVPIVGEATYAVSEIVEDRHSALLVKPGSGSALAHRAGQIVTDTQLAWKVRDTARHEAYSFFSRQRYCQNLRTVYEQIVDGATVMVPPMESTGGLRFSGRA